MGIFSSLKANNESRELSEALIEHYSKNVTEDETNIFSYVKNEKDEYLLVSKVFPELEVSVEDYPEEIKEKGIDTPEKLRKYMYRTQKPLSFDKAIMKFGEHQVDPKKILLDPKKSNPYPIEKITKFYLIPKEFPKSHAIEFDFDGKKESFLVRRQPLDSETKLWFQSVDDKPIKVSYYLDVESHTLDINIDFKINRCTDFSEALTYSRYMDAFYTGKTKLFDFCLPKPKLDLEQTDTYDNYNTRLYEKICKLEEYFSNILNREFFFNPKVMLEEEEHSLIHQLYYSLVLDTPFKMNHSIHTLELGSSSKDNQFVQMLLSSEKEKVGALTGHRNENIKLLGEEFSISLILNYAAIRIVSTEYKENKIVLTLEETDKGFTSGFYYLESKYDSLEPEKVLEKLCNAQEINF